MKLYNMQLVNINNLSRVTMITINNTQTNLEPQLSYLYRQVKRNRRYVPPHKLQDATVTSSTQLLIPYSKKPQVNYIASNKKKLKNFFHDRIPKQQPSLVKQKPISFSPSRILEFRKEQNMKKEATKLNLKQSMDLPYRGKIDLKKMNQTFSVSSMMHKKKMTPNKFNIQLHESETTPMLLKTYQTGTHSSHLKRCETAKKRAYISVFGKDKVQLNMSGNPEKEKKQYGTQIHKKMKLMRNKTQKLAKDKQKFRQLISKIQEYSSQLNTRRNMQEEQKSIQISRQTTETQSQSKTMIQNAMMTGIQEVSNKYKKKIDNLTRKKVIQIQDMEPQFVESMKKHKQSRLKVRNQNITEVVINKEHKLQIQVDQQYQHVKISQSKDKQVVSDDEEQDSLEALLTITDRNKNTINEPEIMKVQYTTKMLTMREKLSRFSQKMVKTNHDSLLFGIPKHKLYTVLWKIRQPFEIQGSYAFFKFIKNGNLSIVQNFIHQNQEYAYQIDNEGRSALIYAVQNQQYQIVKYLISLGFNINREGMGGTTALYYAIKTNNYDIVEILLKNGASPWSTNKYSLKPMLELCSKRINMAIKNSRKVLLACQLCFKFSQKLKIWQNKKDCINGDKTINFQ